MWKKTILTLVLFILSGVSYLSVAQVTLKTFTTIGTNPIQKPVYTNVGVFSSARYGSYYITYAFDFNLMQRDVHPFNAIYADMGYNFNIKAKLATIEANFLYKPSTALVNELNWGAQFKYNLRHWKFCLGTNFKSFRLNKDYTNTLSDKTVRVINERPSMTYRIQYFLNDRTKDKCKKYNLSFMLTNMDWFVIQQETNPFVGTGFYYNFQELDLTLFTQVFYETAGFNNIRVNYFGFYVKGGVSWYLEY